MFLNRGGLGHLVTVQVALGETGRIAMIQICALFFVLRD
jgi:hypothetical protein